MRKSEDLEVSVYLTAGCFAVLSHEATAPNWKQRRRGARPRRCGHSLGGSDKRDKVAVVQIQCRRPPPILYERWEK